MFQIKFLEELKTHILYSATISENHAVYETVWESIVERDRV